MQEDMQQQVQTLTARLQQSEQQEQQLDVAIVELEKLEGLDIDDAFSVKAPLHRQWVAGHACPYDLYLACPLPHQGLLAGC